VTCAELDDLIATKTTELGNVNEDISDKADEIDEQTSVCQAYDTYPNGCPTPPLTNGSIDMRVSYLQMYAMMNPSLAGAIALLIEKYNSTSNPPGYGVKTLMAQKVTLQGQATTLQMEIQNALLQKQMDGCP
jgi:hypothetical protein